MEDEGVGYLMPQPFILLSFSPLRCGLRDPSDVTSIPLSRAELIPYASLGLSAAPTACGLRARYGMEDENEEPSEPSPVTSVAKPSARAGELVIHDHK